MNEPARATEGHAVTLGDVQRPVARALALVPGEMWRMVSTGSEPFAEVGRRLMLRKGKMLRPTLLLLASECLQKPEPRAASYAAILELIHLATLVHDDAVDHSVLRRGMPTVNALFTHQVAIIAGDFLYSRAIQELTGLGDMEPLRVLARATNDLTLGEMRQLSTVDALAFSQADYESMIKAKTSALFSAACEIGALCGSAAVRDPLRLYGERLGMAFQIADDLLDYSEDPGTTGKPAGQDLREHKVTLPLIYALRAMPTAQRAVVDDLFREPEPSDLQIARVVEVVRERHGLEYARRRGAELACEAESALAVLCDSPARRALLEAVPFVMARTS